MRKAPLHVLRRSWVRRVLPAGVAAVLVVGGTLMTRANASASPVDTYRTSTVGTGSVEQRLNLTGSVRRVNQVSQGFVVAGTVSGVSVSVGDTVTAGQPLATLDPAPLHSAVTGAEASLARARATLESDQSTPAATGGTGGTAGATTVTQAPPATPTTSPRVTSPSGRSGSGKDPSLARAQQRVTSSQKAITADLGRASAALAKCVAFFPSAAAPSDPPPVTPTTPPTTTPGETRPTAPGAQTPTRAATTTTPAPPSDATIKACIGALRTAPTQQEIQRDQQALTRSQSDLMTSVTLAITTAGSKAVTASTASPSAAGVRTSSSQSATSQSATSQSSRAQSASGQSSGGQTGGTGQSSASRVISDQDGVTKAAAALSSAQTDLTAATLRASIAGTVGSVSLVGGASSGGKNVVIVGAGAVAVTVNVPLASLASMHVGQQADVTPQGATSFVPGAVTSISLLPSTTASTSGGGATTGQGTSAAQGSAASSSPTYPLVVLVPDALPALASGSRAEVSLLIGTARNVLAVPNSALTPLGSGQALALTIKGGVTTRALVRTGYAGTLTTQVTSGLTAGQQVVLADLSTALPTNTTGSRRFGVAGGAAGGFGGSGLGGSGLGGGAITGGNGFPSRGQ